jgi:glycosyltransferase involved in cell wall biosynthesis
LDNAYILISACRNEEDYVEGLIDCVAAQTRQPLRWLIIDDGSTDDTYGRAITYGRTLPFLQVVKMPSRVTRSFTSQVYAAQHGYELSKALDFDFVGFVDADIRFLPNYYAQLLNFFQSDPRLGLSGGLVLDQYDDRIEDTRRGSEDFHVPGGVQLFRRECFEQIGGYHPIDGGGQDTIADVMAMMHGWTIRVFPQLEVIHLRPEGANAGSVFKRGMNWGRKFYLLGYHPLFYCGQCIRRISRRPIVIGSIFQLLGFAVASVKSEPRPVSAEFVRFQRNVQRQRMFSKILSKRKIFDKRRTAERGPRSHEIV